MELIKENILAMLLEGLYTDKPSKFKDLKKHIGTSHDFTGLSVPQQRVIFKQGIAASEQSLEEQLAVWDELWKTSRHYEIMNFAQMFVSRNLAAFEPAVVWKTVKHWVQQVDNWAHSDGLSSIYVRLLEKEPELIYSQYKLWNSSTNPWERRQSVVGLLYYSSARKNPLSFEKIVTMITPLLRDENYFVQKGVGWTLRETGNVYPAETLAYLDEHVTEISSIAFTAAIEKLAIVDKDRLKGLRKKIIK